MLFALRKLSPRIEIITYRWLFSAFLLLYSFDCTSSPNLWIFVALQSSPDVSILYHYMLRLTGQKRWPYLYSLALGFQLCHAITSKMKVLLFPLAVFLAFPTIPFACSILHTDFAEKSLQNTILFHILVYTIRDIVHQLVYV